MDQSLTYPKTKENKIYVRALGHLYDHEHAIVRSAHTIFPFDANIIIV